MIHNIITSIAYRLNIYIKNRLFLNDDVVIVGSLVDLKGSINEGIENKVSLFLIGIEEERTSKTYSAKRAINNPVIILNINVMFASYFQSTNYVESLRYISLIIEFFQKNPVLNFTDTPGLPLSISKLHVELYSLNTSEALRLWSGIGAKYVPSCAFKIKQVTFDSENLNADIPPIT